jgi:hypothetical protein
MFTTVYPQTGRDAQRIGFGETNMRPRSNPNAAYGTLARARCSAGRDGALQISSQNEPNSTTRLSATFIVKRGVRPIARLNWTKIMHYCSVPGHIFSALEIREINIREGDCRSSLRFTSA